MKSLEDFLNQLKLATVEKSIEESDPNIDVPTAMANSIADNFNFTVNAIIEYHKWLEENYDIKPKSE